MVLSRVKRASCRVDSCCRVLLAAFAMIFRSGSVNWFQRSWKNGSVWVLSLTTKLEMSRKSLAVNRQEPAWAV